MRRFAILCAVIALALSGSAQTRFRRIRPVGEYSNIPAGPRARGFAVELWRVDNDLAGLFIVATGQAGDPPVEALDDIRYNVRTGAISFNATMTTGCDVLPGLKLRPAREIFEFTGVLTQEAIKGKVSRKDAAHSNRSASVESVELAKRSDATLIQAGSYNEWKEKAGDLASAREPNCRGTVGDSKKRK
jgi:hypothetical protein